MPALVIGQGGERELGRPVRVLGLEPLLQAPRRRLPVGTVGEQEQARQVIDELRGLDQDVHRRLVAPVEVLEDQEPRLVGSERAGRRRDQLHDRLAERLPLQGLLPRLRDTEQRSPDAHVRFEPFLPARVRWSPRACCGRGPGHPCPRSPRSRPPSAGTASTDASRRRTRIARFPRSGGCRPRLVGGSSVRMAGPFGSRLVDRAATCPRPASPTSETMRPPPDCASSTAPRSSSISRSRPTSGEPRIPRIGPGSALRPRTRYASTGSALPLTSIPPRGSRSKSGSTSRCVSAVICTVPGSAVCSMRAATFTASPIAVYSRRRSEPTCPTITGPVLMPTRTSRSSPCSRSHLLLVAGDPRDDVEPCPDRALRVVLVRDRRAEEREDRVAHQPGERSLVAVDRRDEPLERAVHDLGPVLGVQGLGHRGRALDVAEQHGDDASLALHGSARAGGLELGEQLLGQEGVERVPVGGEDPGASRTRCRTGRRRGWRFHSSGTSRSER